MLRGSDLLDTTPSEARLEIYTYVRQECSQNSPNPSCSDMYRVRISRAAEE